MQVIEKYINSMNQNISQEIIRYQRKDSSKNHCFLDVENFLEKSERIKKPTLQMLRLEENKVGNSN